MTIYNPFSFDKGIIDARNTKQVRESLQLAADMTPMPNQQQLELAYQAMLKV